jgi:hypothetical protein
LQLARFDVRCGHIDRGVILETQSEGGAGKVTVTCVQPVNIIVDGGGVSLQEGDEIALSPEQAQWLASQGYVEMSKPRAAPRSAGGDAGDEQPMGNPMAPKVPRKPV